MPISRTYLALLAALVAWTPAATAQQSPTLSDSSRAQIHTTLRAFYFNLAHQDVEALTADILAAKVVAHRHPPVRAVGVSPAAEDPTGCTSRETPLVAQATIALQGDWAEVSVPRCRAGSAADEFRLIRFEERWRFVHIHLFQEPVNVSTDR
jgi:hypothetical protein